jgi:hypothetical protein
VKFDSYKKENDDEELLEADLNHNISIDNLERMDNSYSAHIDMKTS